ncbi:hypothetical protein FSP39_012329 [Pinctada imbricata]|uniref:Nucleolar protein 14 n=1 Tax=Pinctada imbricata TaxID=66713 RepID=A0AA88Y3I4_PINIB|nr:hypothetical protein FSP39_012329 [Pinctada imbricata]
MGKKKKNVADKVRGKKKDSVQKVNPFEVKINKQKHAVLGRKISKHDRGMPGLSRSKGIKKRKETLLQEYKQRHKSNKFVDKRIGEHDASLSLEEKMMKRFAKERVREKGNKFSLNDAEEELTHYGQSLSQIEKFEEPEISDDDDEEDADKGRISGSLVTKEHFGGFLEDSNYEGLGNKQSWKERMEELITKTRKERHERQMEKEKAREETEKLDSEWKDLVQLMMGSKVCDDISNFVEEKEESSSEKPKVDDYDVAVRELKFEMKGKASDRLKTEEEIAKEEKERLEKLERERQNRMRGISEDDTKTHKKVHFSADDLNDGFAVDDDFREPFVANYKDGKLDEDDDSEDEDDEEEEEEGDNEEDNNSDEDGDEEKDDVEEADDGNEEDENEEDENEDDSDDDSYDDLASDKSDGEEDETEEKEVNAKTKSTDGKDMNQKKKDIIEAAKKELPYTFKAPESYDDLLELLHTHSDDDQMIIIARIRKCHHVSLAEGNREKLEVFFSCLLQYYCDLALQLPPKLTLMDKLVPHLYELTQGSPVTAAQSVVDQITERREEFQQICDRKGGRGQYPALDTLLLLKLVVILFPTSDFRHSVTTPAHIFITQMLSQCPVRNERDIAAGLFLSSLCLEYVTLSKRFIPECTNFLHGLLFLASQKSKKLEAVIPPFKPVGKNNDLLVVNKDSKDISIEKLCMSKVLSTDLDRNELSNNKFRICAINTVVVLLKEFIALYKTLPSCREIFLPFVTMVKKLPVIKYPSQLQVSVPSCREIFLPFVTMVKKLPVIKYPSQLQVSVPSCREIFSPFVSMVKKLPVIKYPSKLQTAVKDLQRDLEETICQTRRPVVMKQNKPKPLKTFEPKIEEVFDDKKKRKGQSKELNERQKMQHKYKKELKGAMREIRKDTQFLARQQLGEQMEKDAERKRKVKEIYQMLATQEGDFKAMKRAKKS